MRALRIRLQASRGCFVGCLTSHVIALSALNYSMGGRAHMGNRKNHRGGRPDRLFMQHFMDPSIRLHDRGNVQNQRLVRPAFRAEQSDPAQSAAPLTVLSNRTSPAQGQVPPQAPHL
eukprot:1133954-Amphidinium_carterae.2